jgi:hypothetical protein
VVLGCVLEALEVSAVSARPERVQRRNITFAPRHATRVRVVPAGAPSRPAAIAPL